MTTAGKAPGWVVFFHRGGAGSWAEVPLSEKTLSARVCVSHSPGDDGVTLWTNRSAGTVGGRGIVLLSSSQYAHPHVPLLAGCKGYLYTLYMDCDRATCVRHNNVFCAFFILAATHFHYYII